jgi:hypothetical protein
VTEETALDHVARVLVRDPARQLVKLKLTQTGACSFRINLLQQSFSGRGDVVLAEPATLDRNLAAGDRPEAQRERACGFKKGTTVNWVPLGTHHLFGSRVLVGCPILQLADHDF